MKPILSTFLLLLATLLPAGTVAAQDEVTFEFSDGVSGPIKAKMEQQAARMLTAINRACTAGSDEINFAGVQFESAETAAMTVSALWNAVHFRTQDDDIYETCLQRKQGARVVGYQVRNIYMDMVKIDDSYEDDLTQEFVIDFDAQGRISNVNIAMSKLQYQELMRAGEELDDMDRRLQIVKFCEDFANAYCKMDLKFMEDIFSDDALIITGTVRQRQKATIAAPNPEVGEQMPDGRTVTYTSHTKEQYLQKLRECFNNQRHKKGGFVSVTFSDYSIVRHGAKPNYYGVTLRQQWKTKGYEDEGIVFLVWDFTDEEHPKIQVRTWQPIWATKRFTLGSFRLR